MNLGGNKGSPSCHNCPVRIGANAIRMG